MRLSLNARLASVLRLARYLRLEAAFLQPSLQFILADQILAARESGGGELIFFDPIADGFSIAIDDFPNLGWGQ